VTILDAEQIDALTEIFNIGIGRAAATLNDIVDAPVELVLPSLRVARRSELLEMLPSLANRKLSTVNLGFTGTLSGDAGLIFSEEDASKLVGALVGSEADAEDLAEGTLLSHLVELRSRLLKIAATVLLIFVPLVPFAQRIFAFAADPLSKVLPGGKLISTDPVAPIFTPFKLTLYLALIIAMPVVLYQVWAFVAPGLYKKEKHFAMPLLASSIVLFYAGVAFAYYVVFPLIFGFVVSIASDSIEVMTDITAYLDFFMTLVLAFGLAFEVPVATVLLAWTGMVTPEKLAKARHYVFLMAFVLGMFLTPPDFISQTLLAVPVYLLYELGIVMSRFFVRKKEDDAEGEAAP
jgi:sec-independent protein translocase protein TatC